MDIFRTLYIDMNGFFASVEQQLDPSLRGRPLAITAIENEAGAVVAASYEAKAFGVTTGTRVYDARKLCPDIVFRPSRHRLYVRVNQRIASVIDEIAEVERIRSIDEFQIGLGGKTSERKAALDLARQIKGIIRERVGDQLRSSIGIGPNHLLAKIAGKIEKPDGLQWLSPSNMPGRLTHLDLDDLPGISTGILRKLNRAGIWDINALYNLAPRHARLIWRSVEGERFVRALQGENIPLTQTTRHGYGHSKMLAPQYRELRKAYAVSCWLVEKATMRLRRDGYVARIFTVSMRFEYGSGWSGKLTTHHSQDTRHFLDLHRALWRQMFDYRKARWFRSVSVHLGDVSLLKDRSGELFLPLFPGEPTSSETLSGVVDRLNKRFGRDTLYFANSKAHYGFFEKG